MATIDVKDAAGSTVAIEKPLTPGSAVSASSRPVVIASDQVAVAVKAASGVIASGAVASGAIASGAVASGAFASGSIADGAMVTLGAKADAKSTATDTTAITLMQVAKQLSSYLALLVYGGGNQSAAQRVTLATDSPGVTALGQALSASSLPVVMSSDDGRLGSLTETAPSNDTNSSGINGRLQRVAQRLTSIIALQPPAIGPQAKAAALAVTVATDQPTVSVAQDTARIANGVTGTNLTPKFQKITASSSGATEIVALVAAKKIRVLAWDLKVNAAVNFKWQSHTAGDITGLYYNSTQGDGVARAFNPVGYFETTAGEALDLNLSGAVAVGGVLTYVEV